MIRPESLPPQLLAYIGDAVYELYIRCKLVGGVAKPVRRLHREAVRYVGADGQAQILRLLSSHLTEQEAEIVRSGRNSKGRVPKSAAMTTYRHATGLEALFGYLYLRGDLPRIAALLELIDLGEEERK
ncbi:MAG: Mini-ribonuclease 3 [Firmicutes bacterium]|nr:Mini-ribonuclease 3 [Bacillota bacterium]